MQPLNSAPIDGYVYRDSNCKLAKAFILSALLKILLRLQSSVIQRVQSWSGLCSEIQSGEIIGLAGWPNKLWASSAANG